MVLVKVHRISSIADPETGKSGKQIELVETRQKSQPFIEGLAGEDEARLVKGIVSQFQSLGIFPQIREIAVPKVTLFLSEHEYDLLGIRFEVNEVYDMELKDGALRLKKPEWVKQ